MDACTPIRDGLTLYLDAVSGEFTARYDAGDIPGHEQAERLIRGLVLPLAPITRDVVEAELWRVYARREIFAST